jgi:hypothetical protein
LRFQILVVEQIMEWFLLVVVVVVEVPLLEHLAG